MNVLLLLVVPTCTTTELAECGIARSVRAPFPKRSSSSRHRESRIATRTPPKRTWRLFRVCVLTRDQSRVSLAARLRRRAGQQVRFDAANRASPVSALPPDRLTSRRSVLARARRRNRTFTQPYAKCAQGKPCVSTRTKRFSVDTYDTTSRRGEPTDTDSGAHDSSAHAPAAPRPTTRQVLPTTTPAPPVATPAGRPWRPRHRPRV